MPAKEDPDYLDQYLEKQTSRLTVSDNYIWTIIAVSWLVVVCHSGALIDCVRWLNSFLCSQLYGSSSGSMQKAERQ